MEKLNISVDSTSDKCPSPPPGDDTQKLNPIPTNNNNNLQSGDESSVKSPWQVLEELAACGDHSQGGGGGTPVVVAVTVDGAQNNNNEGRDGDDNNSSGDNTAVAMEDDGGEDSGGEGSVGGGALGAVSGGGGDSTVEEDDDLSEGVQEKRRKISLVRDPPTGKPTCPLCLKEFPTWKSAFGHMRAHPDRDYRGFFRPPLFGSPSSIQGQLPSHDKVEEGEDDSAMKSASEVSSGEQAGATASSPIPVRMFDLNKPGEEEGPHAAAAAAELAQENNAEEGTDMGFDLNQLPPAEE